MKSALAGYISGSGVDLARARHHTGWVELYEQAHYSSKGYRDLESILSMYLKTSEEPIDVACFGVAGPVIKNEVSTTNLPWHIAGEGIEARFGIGRVKLVNDIVATAHGLTHLSDDKFYTINEGVKPDNGNLGLIAPGTGLGEALVYRVGDKMYPYASEGGHADFAPGNQMETELWQYVYSEQGHVEVEDILSISGLERICNFLVDTQGGARGSWMIEANDPALILIEKALAGKDETAARTLDIFIDCLASEAANVALNGMTLGGVYIGGGIAPRIITALDQGKFMARFVKQGKMDGLLAKVPVGVIIEDKAALIGAAGITSTL
ncbi:MAG: glucokinase [Candidatus Zixiibacteriota bacterium]|nr:MAG: glucokinase [candidate division Zixibacteria bacterium]